MDENIDKKIEKLIAKLCDEIFNNGYDSKKIKSIVILSKVLVEIRCS